MALTKVQLDHARLRIDEAVQDFISRRLGPPPTPVPDYTDAEMRDMIRAGEATLIECGRSGRSEAEATAGLAEGNLT